MNWLEISVETEAAAVETVCAVMHEYGEGGVSVHQDVIPDDEDAAYHYDSSRPTIVSTYVPATDDGLRRREAIVAAFGHLTAFKLADIGEVRSREVADEDWANAWKEYFQPMRFGRRLVVKPSWRTFASRPDDLVVELDPGMAFGTGLHQTTALCLEMLENYVQPGMRVLDQGAGSGILSLAAARLGAGHVVAVDVSEVAVLTARENVARNGLDNLITVLPGSAVPGTAEWAATHPPLPEGLPRSYDLVVANIIANVIIALAPRFAEVLVPGCPLIASGIIREREEEVRAALQAAGFSVERAEHRDEWVALVARLS